MAASYYKGGHSGPLELLGDRPPLHIIPSRAPETVKIATDDHAAGFIVINADDFDDRVHTRYVEDAPKRRK